MSSRKMPADPILESTPERRLRLFSVVIPAFNEEKLLPTTLKCIHEAARTWLSSGYDYEIVVCDNNSTDRTRSVAEENGARVVFEPVNQISRARNSGARAAKGQWLVFVDADSSPGRGLFEAVLQHFQTERIIGGGSVVRLDKHIGLSKLWLTCWNTLSRVNKVAAGSFIFCEASAFHAVGGFSEKLYASEEIDFSVRLKRLGRTKKKKFVILTTHPLLTSSRKLDLYTRKDLVKFFGAWLRNPFRSLRDPKTCFIWYDGRR